MVAIIKVREGRKKVLLGCLDKYSGREKEVKGILMKSPRQFNDFFIYFFSVCV